MPPPPLPTLLSQVLVAYTIEFDNEFEGRVPHRTTTAKQTSTKGAPYLTSLAMWLNFMQFVDADGIALREFQARAGLEKAELKTVLLRMSSWWRYVTVGEDRVIRPTPGGLRAMETWRPLFGEIERRWEKRFGKDEIANLRNALVTVASELGNVPSRLPILGYAFFLQPASNATEAPEPHLAGLLSKVLLAFALDVEKESHTSFAMNANVLRAVPAEGLAVRDLPARTGISKEAATVALGFLDRNGYIEIDVDPKARMKVARITPKGQRAKSAYAARLEGVERQWNDRFGAEAIANLRSALETILDHPSLSEGLVPPEGGWRSSKAYAPSTAALIRDPRARLPHFPMTTHRGGWPDGS